MMSILSYPIQPLLTPLNLINFTSAVHLEHSFLDFYASFPSQFSFSPGLFLSFCWYLLLFRCWTALDLKDWMLYCSIFPFLFSYNSLPDEIVPIILHLGWSISNLYFLFRKYTWTPHSFLIFFFLFHMFI